MLGFAVNAIWLIISGLSVCPHWVVFWAPFKNGSTPYMTNPVRQPKENGFFSEVLKHVQRNIFHSFEIWMALKCFFSQKNSLSYTKYTNTFPCDAQIYQHLRNHICVCVCVCLTTKMRLVPRGDERYHWRHLDCDSQCRSLLWGATKISFRWHLLFSQKASRQLYSYPCLPFYNQNSIHSMRWKRY